MIIVNNSEALFDKFTAAGLNMQQALKDAAGIVQNDGVELTDREVSEWAGQTTKMLMRIHREQMQLVTDTLNALRGMKV